MRLIAIFFFILGLTGFTTAHAQDVNNAPFYEIADVGVDVTAKNAAQARDQAIIQAQRQGLNDLLARLGVGADVAKSLSSDDIATLVQSFEVQNERSSGVRYIGTFSIQFKPNAVRSYLTSQHANFAETRSRPFLILPVYAGAPSPILWEQPTKWRAAWDASAPNNGVVPITLPTGDIGDLSLLTTADALAGKNESIKALADKYQAEATVIAILKSNLDIPGVALQIEAHHFGADGSTGKVEQFNIPASATVDAGLATAVKKIRTQMDMDWRATGSTDAGSTPPPEQNTEQPAPAEAAAAPVPAAPTAHLSVVLAINSLSEWSAIKSRLTNNPNVVHANVITLQRGATKIDLEFRGTVPELQKTLQSQGLILSLNSATGSWILMKS